MLIAHSIKRHKKREREKFDQQQTSSQFACVCLPFFLSYLSVWAKQKIARASQSKQAAIKHRKQAASELRDMYLYTHIYKYIYIKMYASFLLLVKVKNLCVLLIAKGSWNWLLLHHHRRAQVTRLKWAHEWCFVCEFACVWTQHKNLDKVVVASTKTTKKTAFTSATHSKKNKLLMVWKKTWNTHKQQQQTLNVNELEQKGFALCNQSC